MRRFDGRLVGSIVGLCLPAVVALLGFAYFQVAFVPSIIANEDKSVRERYRDYAQELRSDPSRGFVSPRGKGADWVKDYKMSPGYWGVVVGPDFGNPTLGEAPQGKVLVWYIDDRNVCHCQWVDRIEERNFRLIFLVGGALLFLVLIGLTAIGVRFFVRYAKDRRDFVAAAAHDLETPVAALRMVLENQASGVETAEGALSECSALTERLVCLVDNLRDFIHRGRRGAPVLSDFDIVAVVREAYRPFAADYRDLLGADVPIAGADIRVHADETLTLQILWNLFANDLKYAAPYGMVSVSVRRDGSRVCVEFADVGRGLRPHEMRRIFERYYRAKSVSASGKGGFGIGLCSAREFARAMGGDLTARANEPTGCVFSLTVPMSEVCGKM